MGQISKIGDVYYIEFYARGLLYSQIAGPDLQAAQKLLEATEAKIAQGEALTIVREIDLPVFFEHYLKELEGQFSAATIRRFQKTTENFQLFLKEYDPTINKLSQITPSVVESYKAYLVKSLKERKREGNPKWINLTLLLLREILEYGIKIGFLNDNPTLHVRLLKTDPKKIARTPRYETAKDLLSRGISLNKICQILKLSDVAQIMYFSPVIPLSRDEIYLI